MKSMAVVIDYQNVHMTAADVFLPNSPKEDALISPLKFGQRLAAVKNASLQDPNDYVRLARVDVFRGLPLEKDPSEGYRRNQAQKYYWEQEGNGIVQVTLRPLKYKNEYIDGKKQTIWGSAQEKGVDVLCALALCRLARSGNYDVVVLASRDTDLAPALDEAYSYGTAKVETVKWFSPKVPWTRGSIHTEHRIWTTSMKEDDFRASLDTRTYQ